MRFKNIEIPHQVNGDGRWYYSKSYVPIYEYEVQGNKYKIKGINRKEFKIGNVIKINYNPQKPKQSYIEGYSLLHGKHF